MRLLLALEALFGAAIGSLLTFLLAGIPKPKETEGVNEDGQETKAQELPQTLVRIPIHQHEAAQREQEKEAAAGAG